MMRFNLDGFSEFEKNDFSSSDCFFSIDYLITYRKLVRESNKV